jgi:hypothetical protein
MYATQSSPDIIYDDEVDTGRRPWQKTLKSDERTI